MREPKSVADFLTYRLLRLSNTLALYSNRRYAEQFGVTLPEWRVMSIIAVQGTTTARDISRVLGTDKGWVGLSVASLGKRGFVTTSPDGKDARRTLLDLTPAGREKHDAIMIIAQQRQKRLLATLPTDAVDTFIASLDRLQAEADQMLNELGGPDASAPASR
jgi:DNA-binding MarR family transcriptional regulator